MIALHCDTRGLDSISTRTMERFIQGPPTEERDHHPFGHCQWPPW